MKCLVLLIFCFFLQVSTYAQERKVKWFVDYGIGTSNYAGKGAYHNSYMVGTVPVENAYTKNPFGKKVRIALSAGIAAQFVIKKKNGILASIDFAKLGSRINLNGVTYPIRSEIIREATGTTSVVSNAVSLAVNGYRILGNPDRGSTYFIYGLVYSNTVYTKEEGKAIDYTRTGEFISNINHKKQNYVQLQTGLMADVYRFRFALQYRLALNGLENTVLKNGDKIRPQSLLLKIAYSLFE